MALLIGLLFAMAEPTDVPFFSVGARQDANPCDFLPCDIGDQWVYRCEYKTAIGPEGHMIAQFWTSTVTIVERVEIPEGTAVVREVNLTEKRFEAAEGTPEDVRQMYGDLNDSMSVEVYLVRGPYVYEVSEHSWNRELRQISERFRERLLKGEFPPEFFFPLDASKAWGYPTREVVDQEAHERFLRGEGEAAPNPTFYYWHYIGLEDVNIPAGFVEGVHHVKWFDRTGHRDVWFKDGIGIVKSHYNHHGTYIERLRELVKFTNKQF